MKGTEMAEHSPGPWYYDAAPIEIEGHWQECHDIVDSTDRTIVTLIEDPALVGIMLAKEVRANGRLIAAAPKLLAAVQALVRVAVMVPIFKMGDGAEALSKGTAAIAEAEGTD